MNFRMIILVLAVFVLIGQPRQCLGQEAINGATANADKVATELALAETARQRAAEARAEWLRTSSLIEEAREAAQNEQWQQAWELAREARLQGELAVEQAERESVAWRERVVR